MTVLHAPQTCLSTAKHDERVLDVTFHYFGCLRASEHKQFFATLPPKAKRRIVEEKIRIRRLRSHIEAQSKTTSGIILSRFKGDLKEWRKQHQRLEPEHGESWPLGDSLNSSVDNDVKASMIYFKDSRAYDVPGFENEFPNQKISVKDLLSDEEGSNPLMQPCEESMIRYFHFPANNMIWVEEAIARYYHEQRPKPDDFLVRSRPQDRTKTQMLLCPEFWKGQQLGDRSCEVHARSMRPMSEVISIDPMYTENSPKNLVLFMPYLHWETDQGRMKSANAVKEASKRKFSTILEVVSEVTANETRKSNISFRLSGGILNQQSSSFNATKAPLTARRQSLGELLRSAAKLAVAMDSYVDEKLMYEYLHADPPMQPRRTLDQSYYGALKSTQARDRDQVVYRATTPAQHECVKKHATDKCVDCHDDIKKVPRLIMVDQLWLWILDEKTVISCFPRRWGKNRADPSAVHKALRTRLKYARQDEIRSAFDIALIIVDQCSRVFFDRTRTIDRQPNLVDIFAEAIRGVTYKQTAAFDQFLTYTHLASKEYNSRDKGNNSATQNTLLNINPEGNLLKEVKDILDELHILTRIQIQQQMVAETFVKHIRHILQPRIAQEAEWRIQPGEENWLDSLSGTSRQVGHSDSAKWTLARADTLLNNIENRISELTTLQDAAKITSAALKDLLTLKQQQSGIFEAREAVKQATETLKQGKSIMLFTVVTIIFLPLSFCATVFGMNVQEFNSGLLTLREEFTYMFPISMAIICTSFLLAFSSSSFLRSFTSLIWAILTYPVHLATTYILTKTGLYIWSRELAQKASVLKDRDSKKRAMMQADAMREKMERRAREAMGEEVKEEEGVGRQLVVDVERGNSSGSEGKMYYSPRV